MPGVAGLLAELGDADALASTESFRIEYPDRNYPFRMVLTVGRGPRVKLEIFNLYSFNRVGYTRETLFEIVGITDGAGNPFALKSIASGLKRYQDVPSALTLWMPNDVKHDLVLCEGGAFTALCNSAEQDRLSVEVRRFPFTDFNTFEMAWSSMIDAGHTLFPPRRKWRWFGWLR